MQILSTTLWIHVDTASWNLVLRSPTDDKLIVIEQTNENFAVPAVGLRELAAASLLGWSKYQLGRYLGRESHAVLRGKVFTVHRGVRFASPRCQGTIR